MLGYALAALASAMLLSLRWPHRTSLLSAGATSLLTIALSVGWASGQTVLLDQAWFSATGSRFRLWMDPLGAPLAVFAAGLTVPIFVFTSAYLPEHLKEHGHARSAERRFCWTMLAFLFSMLLLILADDLLLIFAALELTAVTSFLLIQFDQHSAQARKASLIAASVTVGSSLLFLIGLVLVADASGTTVVSQLVEGGAEPSVVAAVCLVVGVLGKSAQVPFQFWLPRAMVAPTPVSAYLHSAALVAAGVFVLVRLRPLWEQSSLAAPVLLSLGFASIALGSVLALLSDGLKRILAYSTIAQYGYMVVVVALGSKAPMAEVAFMIVAHGLCKCALFLTAGAVTQSSGASKLSQVGGLLGERRTLAAASGVACLGLAGLPLTVGYFKDEYFFVANADQGAVFTVIAATAAAFSFAYAARFWLGIFCGPRRCPHALGPMSWGHTGPIVCLAVLVMAGGIWTSPFAAAFKPIANQLEASEFKLAYHLKSPMVWMALSAWLLGTALVVAERRLRAGLAFKRRLAAPATVVRRATRQLLEAPAALYRLERWLVARPMANVTFPAAAVLLVALLALRPPQGTLAWPSMDQWTLALALLLSGMAAVLCLFARSHVALVLSLSFVGFGIALCFAFVGAPNVALVVVIIETALTVLFFGLLWQVRTELLMPLHRASRRAGGAVSWTATLAFGIAFSTAYFALDNQAVSTVAMDQVRLAEAAHEEDVVTAILSDFRGLDTMGELTVLAIAVLGARSISWGRT